MSPLLLCGPGPIARSSQPLPAASFVLHLNFGATYRVRHSLRSLFRFLAQRDLFRHPSFFGDHRFFRMLFGFDDAVLECVLSSP